MSDTTNTDNGAAKKRTPDYIAYAVRSQGDNAGPKYTRIGVGFTNRNGGITVNYDATPLSGQIVLLAFGQEEKPTAISYGHPTRKPDFDACMVRGEGKNAYWNNVGEAYRQDGYISILLEAVPHQKLVLSVPKENR